jgi:rSAM/selenodomain-associated transferase 2
MTLAIVIPVLNEADGIVASLTALASLRENGVQIVIADGGSEDGSKELATPLCDRVVTSRRGRAVQMNAGAAAANGNALLFLHADTRLPPSADRIILEELRAKTLGWGHFDISIEGQSALLPLIAASMNLRSRLTGIATGDRAMFMTRETFDAVGGFPEQPLMEDIEMSRRLKRLARPIALRERVTTSGRRWDQNGPMRTMLLMWQLRLAYFLGAEPAALARRYGYRAD